jgi:hypothetical protein
MCHPCLRTLSPLSPAETPTRGEGTSWHCSAHLQQAHPLAAPRCVHTLARKRGPRRPSKLPSILVSPSLDLSKSGPPASAGANGDCCSSRIGVFSCQRAAAAGTRFKANEDQPLFHALRARERPHSVFLTSPPVEGDGAPTRRSARIAPGQCPAAAGPWCTTVHPRLAARQRASSAYASSTPGPARSSLSLVVFSERRPWVGLRDCRPAGALPLPPCERLRKAPLEHGSGCGRHSRISRKAQQIFFAFGE